MSDIVLYRKSEMDFVNYGGPPGNAEIARLVGPKTSSHMGCGIAVFEQGVSIPWTVLYDEAIVVLEGHFTLRSGEAVYECDPGDVLWLPENTPLVYEAADRAVVFYSLYPIDWKARHGLD